MAFGLGEFFSIACALVWAIAVILFKKGGESLSPGALNLFKSTLALTLVIPTIAVASPAWPGIPLPAVLITMLSGYIGIGFADTLYLRALNVIGASRMAVAQTLFSPSVIALSTLFLAERLHALQWLGVAAVLFGIALVNHVPRGSGDASDRRRLHLYVALGVSSVMLMATGIVMVKPLLERYDFFWLVELRLIGGVLGMLGGALVRGQAGALLGEFKRVRHWPQIIAGSFAGTYLSTILWLAGYKYTRASIASVLNETAALFIVILAVSFLGERLNRRQLLGIVGAVGGVLLVVGG